MSLFWAYMNIFILAGVNGRDLASWQGVSMKEQRKVIQRPGRWKVKAVVKMSTW